MEVSRQSITLKLFGHQLTAAKIREMLKQLDIYKIDKLIFEYDTDYYYDCKIDKISSITKSNIQSTADGVKYDIEFSITFTTVNDNYGLSTNVKSIDFTKQTDAGIIYLTSSTVTYQGDGFLPTEVEFDISLSVSKTPVSFILKENENTLLSFSTPVFANTTTSTATMTYIYNTNTGALTTIANSVAHLVK